MLINMENQIKHIKVASSGEDGNIGLVLMPVSADLSIESLLAALEKFKDKRLLNVCIIITEKGSMVEFKFKIPLLKNIKSR